MPPDGPPVVSWSRTSSPALVLGRSARKLPVDLDAARAAGVAVLQRASGGGPVLWDAGLLALDVVLPRGHGLAPADVVEGYRWLGEAIAAALRDLGVPGVEVVGLADARADSRRPRPAHAACFGGLSPYEVRAGGRKVVGLCQVRRGGGTLLQAGLLLRFDAEGLGRLIAPDPPAASALAADLTARAAGLDDLRPGLGADALVARVDAALERAAGSPLTPAAPTAEEAAREAEAAASPTRIATGSRRRDDGAEAE